MLRAAPKSQPQQEKQAGHGYPIYFTVMQPLKYTHAVTTLARTTGRSHSSCVGLKYLICAVTRHVYLSQLLFPHTCACVCRHLIRPAQGYRKLLENPKASDPRSTCRVLGRTMEEAYNIVQCKYVLDDLMFSQSLICGHCSLV